MDFLMELPQQLWQFLQEPGGLTLSAVIFIATVVACLRIFWKAGVGWWKALIPLYNVWTLSRLCYGTGLWSILYLIPVVNIFFYIAQNRRLCKVFGKGLLFTIGLIFFEPIFILILGFSDAKYKGPLRGMRE